MNCLEKTLNDYEKTLNYWTKFRGIINKTCEKCERYVLPIGTTSSLPIRPIYGNDSICLVCKKLDNLKNDNSDSTRKLTMTTRENVYKALDSERDYQDETAKKWNHQGIPSLEAELLMMEHYLQLTREKWATSSNKEEVLEIMRKVSGISVRCFENYGVSFQSE